jgi:broad specificity phosphatase PhoE
VACSRVVLVKHASPIPDPSRPAREWRLGEEGEAQSRRLADRLRAFAPLRLVASPEPKAFKTGQIVAAELDLPITSVEGLEEFDRPVMPMMLKAEYERVNAAIFADFDRQVLGVESARGALSRFSAALGGQVAQTEEQTLVVITHGTVISLFACAHNELDPLGLWKCLSCPSVVVMEVPTFALVEVIVDAA